MKLGFVEYVALASQLYNSYQKGKGGGGGEQGGGSGVPGTFVSTNVSTQVSPQISPVFIQQDSPVNSAINAGTVQSTTGAIPMTGSLPGFDAGLPMLPTLSNARAVGGGELTTPMLLAGMLLLGAFVMKGKRRKGRR